MFGTWYKPITQGNDWFVTKPALEATANMQNGMMAAMLVLTAAVIVYAIILARRSNSLFPIYILLGSALACFYEPLGDLLAHVTYHEVNQVHFTTAFGFSIPLWVLPSYVVFFGFPVLVITGLLERGVTFKFWMTIFFVSVAGAWLFEFPILGLRYTEYYGANQPWKILHYPVWMGFVNTCTMFVVAAAVFFLKHSIVGERYPAFFVALFPMLVVGANGGAALPLGSAINASSDPNIVNLMAWGSILLSTFYAGVAGLLITTRKPVPVSQRQDVPANAHAILQG